MVPVKIRLAYRHWKIFCISNSKN